MLGPLLPDLPAETKAELGALLPSLLRLLGGAAVLPPALQMPLIEGCLGCLAHACALPPHTLQPHKRQVLAALRAPLDHKKKETRRLGCVTDDEPGAWYAVDLGAGRRLVLTYYAM